MNQTAMNFSQSQRRKHHGSVSDEIIMSKYEKKCKMFHKFHKIVFRLSLIVFPCRLNILHLFANRESSLWLCNRSNWTKMVDDFSEYSVCDRMVYVIPIDRSVADIPCIRNFRAVHWSYVSCAHSIFG